ncbi:hypothetical protein RRG08_002530, partial [Elysia crispata]
AGGGWGDVAVGYVSAGGVWGDVAVGYVLVLVVVGVMLLLVMCWWLG